MAITNTMLEGLIFVEQVYYEEGAVPTDEAISDAIGVRVETANSWWKNQDFRNAVQARGIPFAGQEKTRALTYEQLLFANMMMNPYDKRSIREKIKDPSLEAYNLSPQQVNAWMRSKTFKDHLAKRARGLFEGAEASAYRNFVQAIESGDQKAITMYFEMTGIYNPRLQVDVNISSILVKVIEIVSTHVRDPAILASIAEDMDRLEIGAPMGRSEIPEFISAQSTNQGEPDG
ncbi:MAG: hypothetical protein ACR2L3_05300 [Actinomycetota bacterium]